jgi:hypothetical protein
LRYPIIIAMLLMVAVSFAGRLEITNGTGNYSFHYIYISSASSDSWGDDQLGSSETVAPGTTRSFTLNNDTYDVRIVDEDGDEYIFWDVPVTGTVTMNVDLGDLGEQYWSGGSTISSGGGTAPVTVRNNLGSWTIWYVYGSPSSQDSWGEDRLGSSLLNPGESMTFYVPAGDYYDFKCQDEDGDTYTLYEVYVTRDGILWEVDLSQMD